MTLSPQVVATRRPPPGPLRSRVPTLREERRLIRDGHAVVAGMDEVGRGALAGPVTVGVVLVDGATRSAPVGLRDSKLLTPQARRVLAPRLRRWALAWGVGHAQPEEIDAIGIIAALRLAGDRALAQAGLRPSLVLLDGSHDWLTPPVRDQLDLFDLLNVDDEQCDDEGSADEPGVSEAGDDVGDAPLAVRTMVKADLRCAAVAAASVLAKTERDALMVERSAAFPQYLWADNKGYCAPEHIAALQRHGPCLQHRLTWRLPGVGYCWNGTQTGAPGAAEGCDDPTGDESPPA